ncbi:ArsB/NhaD family transporter [Megasphaera paucivorans]|uniref:Possible tyrosine transporter P-protein (TC 2.A.45.2.1) n=1 Tax=Megasphaera paucivorans TaxID=349095 RepID=A0A1G9WQL9_9FIRM|nr:ArsB/NhaD family transporter [Megasphaera paucivorans]SDM86832.1 possible tyrosine transporter P-protein (TC 2.A.45.2.1) [Megasphaera paucivorans]
MFYFAIVIFMITYLGIVTEKIPRTYAALAGGMVMIFAGYVTQEDAIRHYIDFNTLGLLAGMMAMIGVIRQSGVFEAMAIWAVKITRGRPKILLALLSVITAVTSSLFDAVTAVLLLAPMCISLARRLEIEPYPFLIMGILISNIGGTALMVGNPPNVMIGSATGLSFNAFFYNLAPCVVLTMVSIVPILIYMYRNELNVKRPMSPRSLQALHPGSEIKDMRLLKQSAVVMTLTILGFIFHHHLGLESAAIAMAGATVLLIITKTDVKKAMSFIHWETLFFFLGLFILVGGIEEAGVISALAQHVLTLTDGDLFLSSGLLIWLAAMASAFVDNIPFTATMIPLISHMQQIMGSQTDFLWWSLALGACFGGNGTIIGASPNLLIVAMAEKEGYSISFLKYMKVGFPLTVLSVAIAHLYVMVRYFMF